MFQRFDDGEGSRAGAAGLAALRTTLAGAGLRGFIVPHADEHQSEYLPPSAERLAWLTGFTGSAGSAIVLDDQAAVFVDGRYTLQAASELDPALYEAVPLADLTPVAWLAKHLRAGDRVGYDAALLTVAEVRRYADACRGVGATLVAVAANPIDALWIDRPAPPAAAVTLHPPELSGEETAARLERLAAILRERKVDAAILTQADSVAWAFNIRGADIAHNPVPLSFAVLRAEGRPSLYLSAAKLSNEVRAALADLADLEEPDRLAEQLAALGRSGARVLIDPASASEAVAGAVRAAGGSLVEGSDPVMLPRALKNPVEIEGARRAHRRDGIAMVRFLAWLDREAPSGHLDEIEAAAALERFRAETAREDGTELAEISFDTISGAGPNGAIVHYRVSRASNRRLEPGNLYLVDSGAQYRDGTTDITRTVAIGMPSAEMRDRFTRVLKGHIAVATARFPKGTTGAQLDGLARQALWQAGLDYDHGTGHGVGSFLSVHEGPARIAKTGSVPLEPGMILSNEPGYYRTGAYGIRIENLLVVTPPGAIEGGDRAMMGFETLTLCPIDRRLVDLDLLSAAERTWLAQYHRRVAEALTPHLAQADALWLASAATLDGSF